VTYWRSIFRKNENVCTKYAVKLGVIHPAIPYASWD
jgi:hypothetical protein